MAIYHMQAKVVSRGKGRSAVAASAYMSCSSVTNEYDGAQHICYGVDTQGRDEHQNDSSKNAGECDGHNEFGLLCIYPSTGRRKVIFCIDKNPESQLSKAFSYVFKRRIVSVDDLYKEMGISTNAAKTILERFVHEGILSAPAEFSIYYHINITREQAIKLYGIVTDERLPERVGDPPAAF